MIISMLKLRWARWLVYCLCGLMVLGGQPLLALQQNVEIVPREEPLGWLDSGRDLQQRLSSWWEGTWEASWRSLQVGQPTRDASQRAVLPAATLAMAQPTPLPLDDGLSVPREKTLAAAAVLPATLPIRSVERKAATEKASGARRIDGSSAVTAPSVPRRKLAKSAVAPEIVAVADSLGGSPGRIFRFVHDEIDFDAKFGAVHGALGALLERRGTAWDQAWLLQQLLTVAGVDARFEWGEVQISVEMLKNITGVDDAWRAADMMTTAGTPIVVFVEGSQVVSAKITHPWVKAHLDYVPNRGVTSGPGDTWVRLDPSLKRFEITSGQRLDAEVPFSLESYLVSGVEQSPRQVYEDALWDYASTQGLGIVSLDELKPKKTLIQEAFPYVPATLRGRIDSVAGESLTVPEDFQQRLRVEVRRSGGQVLLSHETTWPEVYGKRLELSWPGATSTDQDTLDLYGGVFSTPPFEVDLRPSLRVEGAEIASGSAIGSAEDVDLWLTWTEASGLETVVPFDMWAGEHAVLSADFSITPEETVDRYSTQLSSATDSAEQEAWALALAAADYQRGLGTDLGHLADLRWQRAVNLGRTVLAVQRGAVSAAANGTPLTFSRGPVALDLGLMSLGLFPAEGTQVSTVSTLELLGSQGSYQEASALSGVFEGDHVSGVTFLTRAVREGQTLTRVDQSNVAEALAAAELSYDAERTVESGVAQGLVAWIPQAQLLVDTFDTTGYVLENPASGAAGYFVTYERLVQELEATLAFHAPLDLDVITAPTDVVATIEGEDVASWTLSYQNAAEGPAYVLASGSGPLTQETLATFDPTLLLNGLYHLVLKATGTTGETKTEKISVSVEGNMKVGQFTLAFSDLSIPLSGVDLEIVRTYDSRRKDVKGDFGWGWSLDVRQGSYENNRRPGEGWQIVNPGGGLGLPCSATLETKSHLTTVRLSEREIFRFRLDVVDRAPLFGGCQARAVFREVYSLQPGAALEILGNDLVIYQNGSDVLLDQDTFTTFEPENVRLTTRDGRIFQLNLQSGLTRIEDPNGNWVDIDSDGLEHSSGDTISFVRDSEGRILEISDLEGNTSVYEYDAPAGNLVKFTDRAGAEMRFDYDPRHLLTEIENPDGSQPVRTDYDDQGRLVRFTDAFGKMIDFTHDLDQRREIVVDRTGATRILEYDERGNVVREIDELGQVTERSFDDRDNRLVETDPLGQTIAMTYSDSNDLTTVADGLGNVVAFTYDDAGRVETVTNPAGGTLTTVYDNRGNVLSETDAMGNTTESTYDARGRLLTKTDALGSTTTMVYDSRGRLIQQTDPVGTVTETVYDALGNIVETSQARTNSAGAVETLVTSYGYDALGRLISTTMPDGATDQVTFDALGRISSRVDPLGRVTQVSYDDMGRVVGMEYPDGTTESRSYDDEGRLASKTDKAGRTTTFTRDAAGRLTLTTFPDGSTETRIYDAAERIVSLLDGLGRGQSFEYDAAGQRTAVVDALGNRSEYTYDERGNQLTSKDPLGNVTTRVYDALSRPISTVFADGTSESVVYDAVGRRIEEVDSAGRATQFGYDAAGRLVSVTDPLDQVTTFAYDEVGNRVSQTDAEGRTTRFEYDAVGRQVAVELPGGERKTMSYLADGSLASRSDFSSAITSYSYDEAMRLVGRSHPDGSQVSFTYSATGQRATMTDSRGVTSYSYDQRDRLVQKAEPDGRSLEYTYDLAGNRTALSATIGATTLTTSSSYDELNRLVAVADSDGASYQYSYDTKSRPTELAFPNGVQTSMSFDSLDRLIGLETATSAGDVLQSYVLTLAPTGQRTRVDEHDGTSRIYTYNELNWLIEDRVVDGGGALSYRQSYSYDAVGNRSTRESEAADGALETTSYTYDDRDRLLTAGAVTYTWNANGNRSTESDGADTTSYEWDSEDLLVRVILDDGTEVAHTYDADGNRVRTETSSPGGATSRVDYLVDTSRPLSQVIATSDAAGTVLEHYVWGSNLLAIDRLASGKSYVHSDCLGSVRSLTDTGADVVASYAYSAFGETVESAGSVDSDYRFAGEALDIATGLYQNRARWMDPAVGRFVSMDPFEGLPQSPATLHRYLYALNDPASRIDPSGEFSGTAGIMVAAAIGMMLAGMTGLQAISSLGRKFIIGFDGAGGESNGNNRMFTHIVENELKGKSVNGGFIENNLEIAIKHAISAKQYLDKNINGRVMALGYSRGGNTALKFVTVMSRWRYPVWSVTTFDAHSIFFDSLQLTRRVPHSLNFLQRNPTDRLDWVKLNAPSNPFRGAFVIGAKFEHDYTGDTTVTHLNIVSKAWRDFEWRIRAAVR